MTLQKTNTNVSPFFDDYDETKNFHRVLFRPRPVQARELNQLQSILQDQVSRFGHHIFTDGSMVLPGGFRAVLDQDSLSATLATGTATDLVNHVGQLFVRSVATSLVAKLQKVIPAEASDPIVFFVEYQNSGSNNSTKYFTAGESLVVYYETGGLQTTLTNATAGTVSRGIWVKSLSGVYFARGHFIRTDDQNIVVSKLNTTKALRIGFRTVEDIVDELTDPTLNSNALGYTNFMGPGASRLRIRLILATKEINDVSVDKDFIEIMRISDGIVQSQIDSSEYAELNKTLAKRTYEESGDYTVTPFGLELRQHLKTGNDGVFLPENGGDEAKFVAVVKPGIGYVQGYRTENVGNQNVVINKARGSAVANNAVTSADYGSYLVVNTLYSVPDADITKVYQLRDASNVVVGSANVRGCRNISGSTWALYVFNMTFTGGKSLANVTNVYFNDASNLFKCNVSTPVLYDGSKNLLVFRLPVDSVKSLKQAGASDTTYSVMRSFNVTTNGSGVATVSLNSNEVFDSLNDWEWIIAYTGASNTGIVIASPASSVTFGGTPVGRSATINLTATHASKTIKILAPVIKSTFIEKSKTVTSSTESIVFSGQAMKQLGKADIYKIISITDVDNGANLLNYFKVDNGMRDSWYQNGTISTIDGNTITRNLTVVYQYFAHSVGDYFSVDSYGGLGRTNIPKYMMNTKLVSLADTVDFRPLMSAAGTFTAGTVSSGEIAKPGNAVRADIEYYLPRIDAVYLDQYGRFSSVSGISTAKPSIPEVPAGTMRLYNLAIPAYTEDLTKVVVQAIDNRRYTMRDIGSMDSRLSNLEYYTSLSLLESQTNQEQIIDPSTGNSRFKNGFAVDGFTDFSLADTGSLEWRASLDTKMKVLRPTFVQNVVDMSQNALSNAQKKTEMFTIAYSEIAATQQLLATKAVNINPYAVFTWTGALTMIPSSDYWKDAVYNAPVILNTTIDNTGGATAGTVYSNVWDSWDSVQQTSAFAVIGRWAAAAVRTDTTTTTNLTTSATKTSISESVNSSSQDNLVGASVIPYMRAIDIAFSVKKMKPLTRIYPFFDGVGVSTQCKQTTKNYNDPIITDASGAADGIFTVPSSTSFRFKTGTTIFRFTDNPTDARGVGDVESASQTLFYSGGTLESREVVVTNTRTLSANVSTTTSTSSSQSTSSSLVGAAVMLPSDPIAQTFRCSDAGGSFVTKIDIAFATKAIAIPVMLQIRTVVAGFPSTSVIPQAEVVMNPADITTSVDGSVMSSFVFRDPIYLEENVEYAVVLLADTQEYTVYVAQMGAPTLVGELAVSKQPHIGTFFQSANGSTWSESQDTDMKFRVWRAEFNTGSASQVTLQGSDPVFFPAKFNPFFSTSATGLMTIEIKGHGLKAGDSFVVSGAATGNGVDASNLNKTQSVIGTDGDFVTVNVGTNASSTGYFGGENVLVKVNNNFGLFYANFAQMVLPNTSIVWEYSYKQQSTRSFTPWTKFEPNNNTNLTSEGVLITGPDFLLRATLSSSLSNLSPVIDTSGMQTVLIAPRINKYGSPATWAKYVSKEIKFNNPSTSATIYVTAKLPNSSSFSVYVQLIKSNDVDVDTLSWALIPSSDSTMNDSSKYFEYKHVVQGMGSFIGYRVKVGLFGEDITDTPSLKSIRTIALA